MTPHTFVAEDSADLWLSASGFGRFSRCEVQWLRHHTEPSVEEPTAPMVLGTLVHRLLGAWWTGTGNQFAVADEYNAAIEDWIQSLPEDARAQVDRHMLPSYFERATTIVDRYANMYMGDRKRFGRTQLEIPFELPFRLPFCSGKRVGIRGYIDAAHTKGRGKGKVWLREFKTMASWQRMRRVAFDPQPFLYMYAWTQMTGKAPEGIIFDGISTYEYKTKQPVEKSFQQVVLPYDKDQIDNVMGAYAAMADRAIGLLGGAVPVKALSDDCLWCPYRIGCVIPEHTEATAPTL